MQKSASNIIALILLIMSLSYIMWWLFTDMTKHNNFRKIDMWEEVETVEDIYDLEDARIDVFIGKDYGYLKNHFDSFICYRLCRFDSDCITSRR